MDGDKKEREKKIKDWVRRDREVKGERPLE